MYERRLQKICFNASSRDTAEEGPSPMRFTFIMLALLTIGTTCSAAAPPEAGAAEGSSAHLAHQAYVKAINSNDLDSVLGMLTDDVVFMAPNDKPYVGQAAVRPWIVEYLKAYRTHWDKPVKEFVVSGDWAFERYAYKSTDTPVAGGAAVVDTGWGFAVYHHDADGKWRVARDAWGSDHPAK
jgi:ketosteroid isomerase-like protein